MVPDPGSHSSADCLVSRPHKPRDTGNRSDAVLPAFPAVSGQKFSAGRPVKPARYEELHERPPIGSGPVWAARGNVAGFDAGKVIRLRIGDCGLRIKERK